MKTKMELETSKNPNPETVKTAFCCRCHYKNRQKSTKIKRLLVVFIKNLNTIDETQVYKALRLLGSWMEKKSRYLEKEL